MTPAPAEAVKNISTAAADNKSAKFFSPENSKELRLAL